jgi:hypothetical protein
MCKVLKKTKRNTHTQCHREYSRICLSIVRFVWMSLLHHGVTAKRTRKEGTQLICPKRYVYHDFFTRFSLDSTSVSYIKLYADSYNWQYTQFDCIYWTHLTFALSFCWHGLRCCQWLCARVMSYREGVSSYKRVLIAF